MQISVSTPLLALALSCTLASATTLGDSITDIPVLYPLPATTEAHIKTVLGTHHSESRANYMRVLFNKMRLNTEINYDAPYFWYVDKNSYDQWLVVTSPGVDMYGKWSIFTAWHAQFSVDCNNGDFFSKSMNTHFINQKDFPSHPVLKKFCELIKKGN